jgi:hypothetical protein
MNLMQWRSWPLGPIPVCLTLWGIYWLVHICLKPKTNWLAYEKSNDFAVYSISATLAVGLACAIRNFAQIPPYVFYYINWLPILSTVLAIIIAEQIDDLLKVRLGYEPVAERYRRWWFRFRKSSSPQQIRKEVLKSFLWPSGLLAVALVLPSSDNLNSNYSSLFQIYRLLLGDTHLQTGATWMFTCVIAIAIRGNILVGLNSQET